MYSLSSQGSQSWLSWFLRGVLTLGFLLLFTRLIDLQLIRGKYFRALAEENRVRRVPIEAPRGQILARGGEVLIGNKDSYKKIEFDKKEGFTKTDAAAGPSEDDVIKQTIRDYKIGTSFAHAGGYVGEVGQDELGKINGECPQKGERKIGDFIGRTGLEKEYDCTLMGIPGELMYEVDAKNRSARLLGKKDPIPGSDVITTIDFNLQNKAIEALGDKKGAVIVSDTKGEILAFASGPSYDPNSFLSGNPKLVGDILKNSELPLFNRAIGGIFHPGSTFKPFLAISALQEKSINPDYTYDDTGAITIKNIYGTYSYKNWFFTQYGGTEGNIGIERALTRSTDTFFYKVGELTGPENIAKWARSFGFGSLTGVDIPGEIAGLVPDPGWKMEKKQEKWFLGDTYNVSIGQGDLAVTPLEMERAAIALSNGGKLCTPHVLQSKGDNCTDLKIDTKNLRQVQKGMEGACSQGGTAFPFFDFYDRSNIKVACKTGTAQNVHEDPHAWFIAYAPSDDPQIVITVLVENGGEGSEAAAPIARRIFDFYFNVPEKASPTPTPTPTP